MSVVKDNYFAALCTQDKNFAICGKIKFSKRMPQKQEQLRVLRNPLDVRAFFISKHFISERGLLRFQMSHPGQSGWPKILTITIAVGGFNSNWSGKNIYPFFSSQTMSSLEKAVKDWIEFFLLFIKYCTLSVIPNPLKIPNLWIWRATSCLTMNLVELTFPLLAVLFDYWLVLLLSYHFLVRLT